MKKTSIIIVLISITILLITILSGCNLSNTKPNIEKFTLIEVSNAYYDGYDAYFIEGTIKNNTNQKYKYIEVTFILYDADGNQLGTATANTTDIEANASWKFKAIDNTGYADKVASYKLLKITN